MSRSFAGGLLVCVVLALAHQAVLLHWYIEDAAISFAYAEHLVAGEGLVPFPGGERVEGYSNPTWVALLAVLRAVGLDLFQSVRWVQLVLGGIAVAVTGGAAREVVGPRWGLVAPGILAVSSTFALWCGAGLETSLLSVFVAAAIWRSLVEARTGGWPVSAVLWFAVAISRPEAILYAAAAGFVAMVTQIRRGRGLGTTGRWLAAFFVPFVLYHAWRYTYFAWPHPNTYYAKLDARPDLPLFDWTSRPWFAVRNFMHRLGWGYFLPVWILGIVGQGGARWRTAAGITAALVATVAAAWVLPPGYDVIPPVVLIVAGIALPIVGTGADLDYARHLTWALCVAVLIFVIVAQWDWMKGYRFFAPAVVPGSVLFTLGLRDLALLIRRSGTERGPVALAVAGLVLIATVPANVAFTQWVAADLDLGPMHILTRVRYVDGVRDRLHIEERLVDLDVDMGAHMLWSNFEMMDLAGLIDVPIAHHRQDDAAMRTYVFEERRPHIVHVHDRWARDSRIVDHPEWDRDYLEIPGYPAGRTRMHRGTFVRRDLIMAPAWPHGGAPIALHEGLSIHGIHVPSEPAAEHQVYVEVGLSAKAPHPGFRATLFAWSRSEGDGASILHAWDLPPGYDWLPPDAWQPGEVAIGRFDLTLPEALVPGRYALGMVVFDAEGHVIPPIAPMPVAPRFATGEVHLDPVLHVLTEGDRGDRATADRQAALDLAARGDCEGGEHAWFLARKHRADQPEWAMRHRAGVSAALSACFVARAAGTPDLEDRVEALIRARELDRRGEAYQDAAPDLADRLIAEGHEAQGAGDRALAYRRFSQAVAVDRSRSWARRYAEALRPGTDRAR